MAVVTAAIVGAAVVGAAATVKAAKDRRDEARRQEKRMKRQEQAAREAANLPSNATETGADFQLGRGEGDTARKSIGQAGQGGGTSLEGAVGNRVGGLSGTQQGRAQLRRRISTGVGL